MNHGNSKTPRIIYFDANESLSCPVCRQVKPRTRKHWLSCGKAQNAKPDEMLHQQICRACFNEKCEQVSANIRTEIETGYRYETSTGWRRGFES